MKKLIIKNTNFLEDYKLVYLPFHDWNVTEISNLYQRYTGRQFEINKITEKVYVVEFDLQYFFVSILRSNKYICNDHLLIHRLFEDFDDIIIIGYNPTLLVELVLYYQQHRQSLSKENKFLKFYVNESISDVTVEEKDYNNFVHKFKYYKYNKEKFDFYIKKNLPKLINSKYFNVELNYIKIDKELLIYLFEDEVKFKIYQEKILKKNISRIISQIPEEEKLSITNKINFPIGLVDSLVKIEVDFNKFDYNKITKYQEVNSYEEKVLLELEKRLLFYPIAYNYITSKRFPSYQAENEFLYFKEAIDFES